MHWYVSLSLIIWRDGEMGENMLISFNRTLGTEQPFRRLDSERMETHSFR
jgi:hypothetical protein